jgi:MFS family permease
MNDELKNVSAQIELPQTTIPKVVTPSRPNPPRTFASLRHRNYKFYFIGQLVSVSGTWMQVIAQGWLVYQISHSDYYLGLVGFSAAIPGLVISPIGGVLADRLSKRGLLVFTQVSAMVQAFVLAYLVFNNTIQVWHIILLSAGLGVINAIDGPARQAFVVEMVGNEDLTNAIALNSVMFNGARVVGPAFGGLMLASVGVGWCFLINGLSFLAVIVGLLAMQLPPKIRQEVKLPSPWKQFTDGIRYVFEHNELFALLLLALIFCVFGISYTALLPAFVDRVLHVQAAGYGAITAAIGLGAVTGAFAIARYGDSGFRGQVLAFAGVLFPIVLIVFAAVPFLALSLILAFFLGILFMFQFNMINSLLQLNVEHEVRGRVLALYTITFNGFGPFGNLVLGNMSEQWGLTKTMQISALLALFLALIVLLLVPKVRKLS